MSRPGQGVMMPVNGLGFPPQNVARVVVWEWLNEHSRWRPYTATVCHHIENVLKEDARGSVVLGQVDAQLVPYIIDLQSMHQFRQDTGEWARAPPLPTATTITIMAGCGNTPASLRREAELWKAHLLLQPPPPKLGQSSLVQLKNWVPIQPLM